MLRREPEYRKNKEAADQKRNVAKQQTDRDRIIAALERIASDKNPTDRENNRNGRPHNLPEKPIFRLERIKPYVDLAGVIGLWFAGFVAIWAICQSTDDSQKRAIATQRAWIKITKVEIVDPGLRIDELGAHVWVSLGVRNLGNSPAVGGTWHVWLLAAKGGLGGKPNPWEERTTLCEGIRRRPIPEGGVTIFPSDDYPRGPGAVWTTPGADSAEIEKAKNLPGQPHPGAFSLYVIGCFDYTFATDVSTHHQTGFVLSILRKDAVSGKLPPFDFNAAMTDIPVSQIEFTGDLSGPAD
jgi:hypothetical protein